MNKLSHKLFFAMGLILGTTSASYSQCTISPAIKADLAACPGDMVTLEASCNRGLQFNGTDHYVNATNLAPLLANLDFSFSAWIKCGATSGNETIFAANTSSGGNRLLFTLNATSGILTLFDGTTQNASATLVNDNQWHHVAFTYNKTTKEANTYVDGTLESTLTLSGMPASGIQGASDQISLGQEFDGASITDLYIGIMDEIRFWDKELAAVEIQNWLDKEITSSHPDYSNLIGYYKLNQYALGSIVDNASPTNDQTISTVNGPSWVSISDNAIFNPSCTYDWVSSPLGFTDSGASVTTSVNQTTTYTVTVTDGNGCIGTADIVAVVNEIQGTDFSSNSVVCENTAIELYDLHGGGSALQFDGNNDWIEANTLSDDLEGSDFTVSMWMNTSGSNENYLFSVNSIAGDNKLLLGIENSTGKILVWNQKRSTILVNDGSWHHVAMSFNNTSKEVTVYVDGAKQFSVIMAGLTLSSSDLISIGQEYDGGSSLGNFHDGAIDEVRVWNSVRSQQEIQDWIWRELDAGQYLNMYAYYNFNEGSGTTANDLTGNGNNGTLKNGTTTANGPQWINADWRVHSWTGPNSFSSSLSNPVIPTASMLAEGTYNCTVSLLGCPGVSSNTVVDMDPVGTEPNITPISSSCENSAAFNLSADIPGGIWTGTGITDPVNGTFDPTLAGAGQHEVIYTTSGGGCFGDDTTYINVLPEISLTTSENTLVCDGESMQLFSGCNHTMVFATDDYININPVASEITNSDFTFSTWIKSNIASGSGNLFAVNTSFGDNRFLVMVNSASGLLELFDGTTHSASTTTVNDDQWHHIVVTYNNTTKQAQTYVDGNPEMLVNLSGMPATGVSATDLVSLGQEYDPGPVASDFFTGKMEEARVWNVLLGQAEITNWMNMQLNNTHPDYANLVAYYTFNDKDNNVLYDYSPAGNNGTIVNTNGYVLSDIPGFADPCNYTWSSVPAAFSSVLADQMVTPGGIVTYHVSVTNDLGCVASDSLAVAELVFQPTVVSSNSPVCEGLDIELYDSTAAGNALSFDGNNDWLEIDALTDDIAGSDFTFSCWFNAGAQTGSAGTILGINDLSTINKNRLIVAISSATGKLVLYDSTTTTIPVNSPIVTDGQWRHLTVTFEIATKKVELFLNGLLIDAMIFDNISTGVELNDKISIGQEFDGNHSDFFSGKIDEIRFWDVKLTQTDILDWLYRPVDNTHPQYANLMGYFPLNGTSGTTVNDESGNNNNAVKKNGGSTAVGPVYILSDWRTQNWSGPGAFSSTIQNPVIASATPTNDGTYDMYFTVLGCDSPSESTIVTVQPNALDPTITPAGPFCSSDGASNLIAATPGGTWFGSGITDTLLGTFDPTVAGSGMHEVIYVADDCAGSSDTTTIEIVAPIISALISNEPMSCGTATGSIQIGGSGTGDVAWSGTSSGNANNVSLPYTITGLTAGSYTITYTDGNGCVSNTLAQSLSNPSLPVIATGGATICEGQSVNISASGATSYSWDNGLGAGSNQTVSPTTTTTYTVTGTTTGCSGTDQLTITVIPLPSVVAAGTTTICEGQSTTIDATGATSYTWDQGLGAGATQVISPTTTTTYTVTGTTAGCTNTDQVTVTITPLPTVIASGTATICEGQSTIIDATGATSYSWDQGLGAGAFQTVSPTTTTTYTITGITAGCSNTDQVTVTVTPLPALIASGTTTICEGQSTTIDATGATSYSWDQGLGTGSTQVVSPTTTTIYTVTGTTTGCTNTDQVIVTVTPLPTVVASGTTTICEGQSTVIDATGATSYLWDQGLGAGGVQTVSPTSTITYTVTGTMTGCTNTDQVTVTVNPAPFISVDLVTDVLCYGDLSGSIDISVSGGVTPYDYLWNSGQITEDLSGIPAGNYNVSVTDANGCLSVANGTVNENPEIVLSAVVGDELFDGEGSIDLTVTGGTAPYLYNWSNGETTEDLSYLHSGTYTVVVTDANGCIDSLTVEVGSQVGIDEIGNNKLISVYPNPTKGKIYVQINGDVNDETIAVYDSAGKRVMSVMLDGMLTEINLETLERGIYFFNLEHTEYFYRVILH